MKAVIFQRLWPKALVTNFKFLSEKELYLAAKGTPENCIKYYRSEENKVKQWFGADISGYSLL